MGIVHDVVFDCPKCDQVVRYQTRYGNSDIKLDEVEEGSNTMEELYDENSNGHCWCDKCGTKIGFVKKVRLLPVIHDELAADPTPEEIARVQEYLARRDKV